MAMNLLEKARPLRTDTTGTNQSSDLSDSEYEGKDDYPYDSRDSLVGGGDDHDVLRRFLVTKSQPLFPTAATTKYLEVLRSGRVRVRDAKRSRLDSEIVRPLLSFESVQGSMKVTLNHLKKQRHFKFSTIDEKDKFFECLRQIGRRQERRARKHRHSVRIFEYVPNEIPIMFLKNVRVERQGSLVKHSGLLAITNYRIVVIESNDGESGAGASAIRDGDKSVVALECPHLCVDTIDIIQDAVQIHTKDMRTLLIDLNALQQPKLKEHCVETLRRQTACMTESDVFAYQGYIDTIRARTPKASDDMTQPTSPRSVFPLSGLGSMSDLSRLVTPDAKEVIFAQLSDDRYPDGHIDEVMKQEYQRWMGPNQSCPFRITDVNIEYELCPTYPKFLVVPRQADDDFLKRAAPFRSRSRLPAIVWSNSSRVTMSRCSQTTTGAGGRRNEFDEELVRFLNGTNPNSESFVICDCRPKANAMANKYIRGKGFEGDSYAQCHVMFFDIENIHVMRSSLGQLERCCENQFSENWLGNLNQTRWMNHITLILNCSKQIANMIDKDKYSVLVHCSDGWDRTAQVCSLGQLFLDHHFRTTEGFFVLIQKEWIYFGHKLSDRCGTFGEEGVQQGRRAREERSPVFLQFLDCVYQVMHQFPWAFEFTPDILLEIWEHVNSGRFGDFFYNCMRERDENDLWLKTPSLFKHLKSLWDHGRFRNPTYYPTQSVLRPKHAVRDMVLWDDLYCRFSSHDKDRRVASSTAISSSLYRRQSFSEEATPIATPQTPSMPGIMFRSLPTPTSRVGRPAPPAAPYRSPSPHDQAPLDRAASNTTISRTTRKPRDKRPETVTSITLPDSLRAKISRHRDNASSGDVPSPPPRARGNGFHEDSSSDSEDTAPHNLTIQRLQNEIDGLKAVIRRYQEGDLNVDSSHQELMYDDPDTYHTDGVIGNIV